MTSNQVHVDKELLEQRLKKLIELYDEVHAAAGTVDDVAGRQTSDYWSTNPSAARFAGAYGTELGRLSDTLRTVRDRIEAMRDALASSAKALATTDEQVSDLLSQLAARFAAPTQPTTTTTTPPTSTTTPTYFPTTAPTTTPVPTPTPTPTSLDSLR